MTDPIHKRYFMLLDFLNKEHTDVALEWWEYLEARK
jgi:hypothetical protein